MVRTNRKLRPNDAHITRRGARLRRRSRWAAAIGTAVLLVAGCGGDDVVAPADDGTDGDIGAPEVTDIRVGIIPVTIYSYFWHALAEGYYEDEGLNVTLEAMPSGPVIISSLEAGELQFGIAAITPMANAVAQGVPVRFVSVNFYQSRDDPVHAVITDDDSVQSPADLEGKTIAVNARYAEDMVMLRDWLRNNDVDPESVEWVEIPFPDMAAALQAGTVSAAGMIEPFYTIAEQQHELRVLGNFFTDFHPRVSLSGYLATLDFLERNPNAVARFNRATARALEDFAEDPDLARTATLANTQMAEEVAMSIRLSTWDPHADMELIQQGIERAAREGILTDDSITAEDIVWEGALKR